MTVPTITGELFIEPTCGGTTVVIDADHDCRMSIVIAAADHPSLADDIARFLDELRNEPRYFGPRAAAMPKPFPSTINALEQRDVFRLAAVSCGRIVGLVRISPHGEMHVAVLAEWRSDGVGAQLCEAALSRSAAMRASVRQSA